MELTFFEWTAGNLNQTAKVQHVLLRDKIFFSYHIVLGSMAVYQGYLTKLLWGPQLLKAYSCEGVTRGLAH